MPEFWKGIAIGFGVGYYYFHDGPTKAQISSLKKCAKGIEDRVYSVQQQLSGFHNNEHTAQQLRATLKNMESKLQSANDQVETLKKTDPVERLKGMNGVLQSLDPDSGKLDAAEYTELMEQRKKKDSELNALGHAWKSKILDDAKNDSKDDSKRNNIFAVKEYLSLVLKKQMEMQDYEMKFLKDRLPEEETVKDAENKAQIDSSN
ncbi:hypothetical protein ACHQM5_007448 [Ranunculus cassubicifolius]